EDSPGTSQSHVLPVLVAVNAEGKIVRIEPAITLKSKQSKALKQAVHAMITKPAMKDGHPIFSQFILQLAVTADKTGNGGTTFSYIASRPAPSGPVHWARTRGNGKSQFALVPTVDPRNQFGYDNGVAPTVAPSANNSGK
ncbi:MAG: hypothetical protein WBW92_11635, partial [Rhodanobacteraceae bacterium]